MSAFPEGTHKNYITLSLFMLSWNLILTEMIILSRSHTGILCYILSTEKAVVVASHSEYLVFLSVTVCHLKG